MLVDTMSICTGTSASENFMPKDGISGAWQQSCSANAIVLTVTAAFVMNDTPLHV